VTYDLNLNTGEMTRDLYLNTGEMTLDLNLNTGEKKARLLASHMLQST
jgi:hypothetical protein